jgi:hypothetical protein
MLILKHSKNLYASVSVKNYCPLNIRTNGLRAAAVKRRAAEDDILFTMSNSTS